LTAINRPEDPDFTPADMDLLLALANQAAIILEHKRAEEAVRASEAKLRTLFELLPVGVSIIDRSHNIVDLNLALENIWGISRNSLLRGDYRDRRYIRPDGTPLRPEEFPSSQALTKQQAILNMEIGVVKGDGATIWTDVSAAPLPIADLGAVVVTTNITERKQAEAALRQYAAELQARNEELDSFSHTVAHDLQSPLGPIIGIAEILAEDYAAIPGEELQKYLGSISRNARKMNSIIRELLLLASVRQQEVERKPLDMAGLVAEAQQRLAHLIEEYQAEIILPASWPVALGYAPWIEEVWANYLSNGLKYGGRPPRLELGATILAEPDGLVRFWVRDNGPGLSLTEQTRLFTPFTRLDRVQVKGYGLGLSIVRRIVEKLGGQVGVESDGVPGHGSAFSFTLPQAAAFQESAQKNV
jgi:PAS domain S-box-containing protein